jgi:iron(III) transport system substrate-binding protein
MVLTEDLHTVLSQRKLHVPFDYKALGVDAKAIDHDNGSVVFVHQITLPGYNTKVVAAKDIPRHWEDFLDPKWSNGKLGIFDARYFALLAVGPWGEKKTTEYVKGLAKQRPFLGRLAEVYTRLELGEIIAAPIFPDLFIQRAKRTGAPIAFAEKVEPVLMLAQNIAVLRGAAHPNLGHLFSTFAVSPEAQTVLEKYLGQSSVLIPGTPANNFLKGRGEPIFLHARDPKVVEKWSDEYNKVLGFTR